MLGRGCRRESTSRVSCPRLNSVWGPPHIRRRRPDKAFRRSAGSHEAPPPTPANWRGYPKRSRSSSRLLVEPRIDVVEQNAQRCGNRNRDENAKDACPAEAGEKGNDYQDPRQAKAFPHHLG